LLKNVEFSALATSGAVKMLTFPLAAGPRKSFVAASGVTDSNVAPAEAVRVAAPPRAVRTGQALSQYFIWGRWPLAALNKYQRKSKFRPPRGIWPTFHKEDGFVRRRLHSILRRQSHRKGSAKANGADQSTPVFSPSDFPAYRGGAGRVRGRAVRSCGPKVSCLSSYHGYRAEDDV
jgi:hypothetical protein